MITLRLMTPEDQPAVQKMIRLALKPYKVTVKIEEEYETELCKLTVTTNIPVNAITEVYRYKFLPLKAELEAQFGQFIESFWSKCKCGKLANFHDYGPKTGSYVICSECSSKEWEKQNHPRHICQRCRKPFDHEEWKLNGDLRVSHGDEELVDEQVINIHAVPIKEWYYCSEECVMGALRDYIMRLLKHPVVQQSAGKRKSNHGQKD